MIIKEVIFYNFRPFYKENKITFCNGEKNVTLFEAENGAGKSTFLEGIRWCLYGNGNQLNLKCNGNQDSRAIRDGAISFINKKALSEKNDSEEISSKIILTLEKNDSNYVIERSITFKSQKYLSDKLKVVKSEKGDDFGDLIKLPQDLIDTILPEDIDFFVNGEKLKRLEGGEEEDKNKKERNKKKEIEDSIFRVLGLKTFQNAIQDMTTIKNSYKKKFNEENVSQKLKKLREDFDDKKADLENKTKTLHNLKNDFTTLENIIETLDKQLFALPKKIENDINSKNHIDNIKEQIKEKKHLYKVMQNNYKKSLSKKSYPLLFENILNNAFNIIKKNKVIGEIPSKYEKEFLNELIIHKECICGAKLDEGTENLKKLQEKIKDATTREEREIFNNTYYHIEITKDQINNEILREQFEEWKTKIATLAEEIEDLGEEYNEKLKAIGDVDLFDHHISITKELEKKGEEQKEVVKNMAICENNIQTLKEEVEKKRKEVQETEKKETKNEALRRKYVFSEKTLENLINLKELKEEGIRKDLSEIINNIYNSINGKAGYKVIIDEKFNFMIKDTTDNSLASDSTGEERNATLSFIGGLLKLARNMHNQKIQGELNDGGGIYPLILDSPYGVLDLQYRENISRCIPELSEQVIILVSSGQWDKKSEDALLDKIGKKYSLVNRRRNNINEKFDITDVIEETV